MSSFSKGKEEKLQTFTSMPWPLFYKKSIENSLQIQNFLRQNTNFTLFPYGRILVRLEKVREHPIGGD